jgi:hypothetical protein
MCSRMVSANGPKLLSTSIACAASQKLRSSSKPATRVAHCCRSEHWPSVSTRPRSAAAAVRRSTTQVGTRQRCTPGWGTSTGAARIRTCCAVPVRSVMHSPSVAAAASRRAREPPSVLRRRGAPVPATPPPLAALLLLAAGPPRPGNAARPTGSFSGSSSEYAAAARLSLSRAGARSMGTLDGAESLLRAVPCPPEPTPCRSSAPDGAD